MGDQVHYIPNTDDSESEDEPASNRREDKKNDSAASVSSELPLDSFTEQAANTFRQNGALTMGIGTAVLLREAQDVNKRILRQWERDLQQQNQASAKRQRVQGPPQAPLLLLPTANTEQLEIWQKTCRIRRMALLLCNLEITQHLVLHDILQFASDNNVSQQQSNREKEENAD